MNETRTIEERIEGSLDKRAAGALAISNDAGGLKFEGMDQVMEFSKLMAVSHGAVPKHLRGNPGACLAICVQAVGWRMDPFAVANKSYFVNDRIAFEAQLVHAVIEQRAPIKGRIKSKYEGEGADRQLKLWCLSEEDGETIEYLSPKIGTINPKNSPLWKTDPDQQLHYYSVRAMCRRFFPDVLLGVYTKDEIEDSEGYRGPDRAKDVTPSQAAESLARRVQQQAAAAAPETRKEGDPEDQATETAEEADTAPTAAEVLAEEEERRIMAEIEANHRRAMEEADVEDAEEVDDDADNQGALNV